MNMETKLKRGSRVLPGWHTMLTACALCLSLAACGPENKPITEPLSMEERQKLVKKDADYATVFSTLDVLEKFRTPLTASEKKTLEDLSYKRLKDFLAVWDGSKELDQKKAHYAGEWEKKYGFYRAKVDSIDNHWKQFMEGYKTKNYLKIELVDIVDKTDVFLGYVKVRLRFTPLKGRVDKVKAHFGLLLKTDKYGGMMERNKITVDTPFSSSVTQDDWMSFNYAFDIDADKVKNLPVNELLEEYDFRTNVTQLVVDGRFIDYIEGYSQVPDCVCTLWKDRTAKEDWEESFSKELDYTCIFQKLIDPSMPAKDDYVRNRIKEDAYRDDKLAATFYYEIAK